MLENESDFIRSFSMNLGGIFPLTYRICCFWKVFKVYGYRSEALIQKHRQNHIDPALKFF